MSLVKKHRKKDVYPVQNLLSAALACAPLTIHGYVGMPFDGPEEFRRQARENILHGVDFLKVFMTKVINATSFIYHFMSLKSFGQSSRRQEV